MRMTEEKKDKDDEDEKEGKNYEKDEFAWMYLTWFDARITRRVKLDSRVLRFPLHNAKTQHFTLRPRPRRTIST